jgi:hypothetical protein
MVRDLSLDHYSLQKTKPLLRCAADGDEPWPKLVVLSAVSMSRLRPGFILDVTMLCVLIAIAYFSWHLLRSVNDPVAELTAEEQLSDEILLEVPERLRRKVLARQEP